MEGEIMVVDDLVLATLIFLIVLIIVFVHEILRDRRIEKEHELHQADDDYMNNTKDI